MYETWQYQAYVEPLHTEAAAYDPSDLAWTPECPALLFADPAGETNYLFLALTLVVEPVTTIPPDLGRPTATPYQIPRVAFRGGEFDPERLRRFCDNVERLVNSLFRRGRLNQLENPDEYEVIAGGFSAARDPGADDDETQGARAGISWVNRTTGKVFFCTSAAEGAATWVQIN